METTQHTPQQPEQSEQEWSHHFREVPDSEIDAVFGDTPDGWISPEPTPQSARLAEKQRATSEELVPRIPATHEEARRDARAWVDEHSPYGTLH
jgi:hypothetical protein